MIPAAIFSILTANTDITNMIGTRIYPEQAPQNVSMPFIVYEIDSVAPEPCKEGVSNLDTYAINLVLFGNDYDTIFQLNKYCRDSMDRYKGIIESTNIDAINFKSAKSGYDNQANVFVLESEYNIREKR